MKSILSNYLIILKLFLIISIISCSSRLKHLDSSKAETPADLEKIAQEYYKFRKYNDSIRVYEELIEKYSDRFDRYENQLAWANYEIGFCYLVTKRYDKALDYFKTVLTDYSILAPRILAQQRVEEIQQKKSTKKINKKTNKSS